MLATWATVHITMAYKTTEDDTLCDICIMEYCPVCLLNAFHVLFICLNK